MVTLGKDWVETQRTTGWSPWGKTGWKHRGQQDGYLGERLRGGERTENTGENSMVTLRHDWGGNTEENRMVTLGKTEVETQKKTAWLPWRKTGGNTMGKQNDHVEERFGGNTEDNRMVTLGKDWVEKKRTTGWLSWGKTARGREDREHRGKQNDHVGERWEERQGKNRRVNLGKDSGKTQGKNRMVTLGIDWGGNTGENRMVTLGHDWDGNRRKQDGYLGERPWGNAGGGARQGKNRMVTLGKDCEGGGKIENTGENRMATLGEDWGGNTGENR
ncbi:hypothetical protein RRG08_028679 [Elysia crispata]|uniref:Uncharacterized protein n=1 Tax=Elysia crispata TaxID=231223 RepID=A0AAE1DDI6_9GAST|nr:hypothetical protein RRG08_028679 [Elysia crispata]